MTDLATPNQRAALREFVRTEAFKSDPRLSVEENAINFAEKTILFATKGDRSMGKILSAFDEMLDAHKAVKEFYPEDWSKRLDIYRLMIVDQMKYQKNVLFAAIVLASHYMENDNARMLIYAAAVEMIEEG